MSKRASIDDYMTIGQLVDFLGVPDKTVYYWLKIKQIKYEYLGKYKVVHKDEAKKAKKSLKHKLLSS